MRSALTPALSQIRSYPSRFVAVTLAVVLGVGFVAATLVFSATYRSALADSVAAPYRGADLIVTPVPDFTGSESGSSSGSSGDDLLTRVRAVPGVAHAERMPTGYVSYAAAESRGGLALQMVPEDDRLRWFGLEEGRWPTGVDEAIVDRSTATTANLAVGQTFSVTSGSDDQPGRELSIVGIADTSSSAFSGAQRTAFVSASLIAAVTAAWGGVTDAPIAVLTGNEVPAGDLRTAVEAAVGDTAVVQSAGERADEAIADLTNGVDILAIVLLGFAVIAVVAAGIVIANTFTILITQRRRQIALTRCVGATSGRVRRDLLIEAGLIGVMGSVLGILVGGGAGWLGARLTGLADGWPVLPVGLAVTAAGGVVLTVLAAVAPASAAMRVAPLVALQPVPEDAPRRRAGRRRVVTAGLLTSAGLALLVLAVLGNQVLLALGGGALSAVGILLLSPTFVPPLLRLVGMVAGLAGVPGRLAALNGRRNPGRAAATAAALMLGVGLIVTMQVGAASAQASLDRALTEQYPVDISITGEGDAISRTVIDAVAVQPGLRATAALPGAAADVTGPAGDEIATDATVLGLGDGADAVLPEVPAELRDDTVLVPGYLLSGSLSVGDRVTVTVGGRSGTFSVAAGALPDQGVNGGSFVLTGASLAKLAPDAAPLVIWAALEPGADAEQVTSELNRTIARTPELTLGGSAPERAATSSALGTIVTVAIGLLAVAVVIAVVGIGNTLGLSVIERTRESALLRALGLQRRQLRLMLAVEAVMLAVIAAIVGVLAGIGYGWVGVRSAFWEAGGESTLAIPWGSLVLVIGVAVVAGLLASVLPSRRAAMTPPTHALAAE
ncbi:ABC transporter permease [Nakamurella sp. GG22]